MRSQSGTSLGFGFTGQQTDATGLVYLRARELDPKLGRFLSPDTVQPNAPGSQGYNLYAYVANNPTTWVDPTGTRSVRSPRGSISSPRPACASTGAGDRSSMG